MRELLELLEKQLEIVLPSPTSSHLPAAHIEPIEKILLMSGKYIAFVPPDYPSKEFERTHNLRRLNYPKNGKYQNILLRIGITTMHLRERGTKRNNEAIVLAYLGEAQQEKPTSASTTGHFVEEASLATLLDNGAVSSLYHKVGTFIGAVESWYPESKIDFGGHPYPKSIEEVFKTISYPLRAIGLPTNTTTFKSLPTMIFLLTTLFNPPKA